MRPLLRMCVSRAIHPGCEAVNSTLDVTKSEVCVTLYPIADVSVSKRNQ